MMKQSLPVATTVEPSGLRPSLGYPPATMAEPSLGLLVAFVLVVLATVILVLGLVRRAHADPIDAAHVSRSTFYAFFGLGIWMALTAALASSGILENFDARPPPMMVLMLVTFVVSIPIAFSGFGTRVMKGVSLAWLIGFQGFRFPLELVMHRAAVEDVMPLQMSYSGQNLDIISGITAIVVGWMIAKGYATRRTPWLWSLLGTGLLINVLVVAVLSTPMFARWGPDELNVWVTTVPFVWLPTVLVPFALIGQLLLWRRLFRDRGRLEPPETSDRPRPGSSRPQ